MIGRALLAGLTLLALSARPARAEDCVETYVVIDGRVFPADVADVFGFDPVTAPSAPFCVGLLGPAEDAAEALRVQDERDAALAALAAEKALREIDRQACLRDLEVEKTARRECEEERAPAPRPAPEPPSFWERPSFWIGASAALGALTIGLAVDKPGEATRVALWAAGGLGVGIVIGGVL